MNLSSTPASVIAPAAAPVGRADRHAEQRHEEDQADQAAPQRAAGGADAGQRRLVQLDLAVVAALDDDHVLELDECAFCAWPSVAATSGPSRGRDRRLLRDRSRAPP